MNDISSVISRINTFISSKNNLDSETIGFLMELKDTILTSQDSSFLMKVQSTKQLPKIESLLRIIGKKAFIDCYECFQKKHIGEIDNIVKNMWTCGGAETDNSARTKASTGSKIFKEGLQIEALENIIGSNRVPSEVIEKAKKLLEYERRV